MHFFRFEEIPSKCADTFMRVFGRCQFDFCLSKSVTIMVIFFNHFIFPFFFLFCLIIMCQIISLLLVTPTSYLALILTFKSLLTGKRDEILNLKTRYEMGLGKLEFASNQVCKMNFEKEWANETLFTHHMISMNVQYR